MVERTDMAIERGHRISSLVESIQKILESESFRENLHSVLVGSSPETVEELESLVEQSLSNPSNLPLLLERIFELIKRRPPNEPRRRRFGYGPGYEGAPRRRRGRRY